jgi:peptide/nickel transport system permease protein
VAVNEIIQASAADIDVIDRVPAHALGLLLRAIRTSAGRTGGALVLIVVAAAIFGPLAAPYSATGLASVPFAHPTSAHLLGTDVLGRDVLSRVLDGGWQLLLLSAAATSAGVALGTAVGVTAAFRGKLADTLLMRVVDVMLAFPQLVFALLLVSLAGAKTWLIMVAVALAHAPQVARVIRAAALDVCERDFVRAGELIALPSRQVIVQDILPNLTSPLMVETGLRLTYSIVILAGLSFIGFGLQPPAPNWGTMINENRIGLSANPWPVLAPVLMIALLTIGMNTLTDAVSRASLGAGDVGGRKRLRGAFSRRRTAVRPK